MTEVSNEALSPINTMMHQKALVCVQSFLHRIKLVAIGYRVQKALQLELKLVHSLRDHRLVNPQHPTILLILQVD